MKRKVYKVQGGKLVGANYNYAPAEPPVAKYALGELAPEPLPVKPPKKRTRNPLASTHTVETLAARIETLTALLATHTKPSPNRRTVKATLRRARQLMRALDAARHDA